MTNNVLGQKIKRLRKSQGLTQAELVGKEITRNMLSRIETGFATPSLETLKYIADRLNVSTAYLVSEDDDLLFFEKKETISKIYRAYEAKNYTACIAIINSLSAADDELNYLLAHAHLEVGKKDIENGSLISAEKNLTLSEKYCKATKLDTLHIEARIPLYKAIAKNIQSPLLEFDSQKYTDALMLSTDFELFKYLTLDYTYSYTTPIFSLHMEAKELMRERNYPEAVKKLICATEISIKDNYNAFVVFGLYTDLEYCYKQLCDFEKAYIYSTKRLTLIESFKS